MSLKIFPFLFVALFALTSCTAGTETSQPDSGQASPFEIVNPTSIPAIPDPAQDLSLPPTADARPAFYVAPDGSDETGNVSLERPWATITHALDSVEDNSLILVRPGLYEGRIRIRGLFAQGVTVRSEIPYQAKLRAMEAVLTIYEAQGISLEGLDIAHTGPGAEPIVVHIQDTLGAEPGGAEFTSRITLYNNIYNKHELVF